MSRMVPQSLGQVTRTHVDLAGCELRARQVGFQSDKINLTFRRPLDNPDVGSLVLYEAGSIVGTIDSVTTMEAPRQARKRFKRGLKDLKKANHQKAAAELEKATKLYPEYSEAWNLLGQVRLQLKDESGAKEAFELAAAGDPNYLGPQIAMMELESQRSDWDHVSQWSTKILELHPYHMQAHYYRGGCQPQSALHGAGRGVALHGQSQPPGRLLSVCRIPVGPDAGG